MTLAQYRSGNDGRIEDHPLDVSLDWTKGATMTSTLPLADPVTIKPHHVFTGTFSYRPFSVATFGLGLSHCPMRDQAISPDTPRIIGSEFQILLGISVATDWMQPIKERSNMFMLRFRGGMRYDLLGRDFRLQTCDFNGQVTEKDLVTLQEHVFFIGMDVGWHNPVSRSLGVVYLTLRLDQIVPVWGDMPLGSAVDLTRNRFSFGLGISR
jgi:hypothetical protein